MFSKLSVINLARLGEIALLLFALTACAEVSLKAGYSISMPYPGNEKKIRFELGGAERLPALPPDAPELKQDMAKQIAASARIYASQKLQVQGLCPNGFDGPDYVLIFRKTQQQSFVVTCR